MSRPTKENQWLKTKDLEELWGVGQKTVLEHIDRGLPVTIHNKRTFRFLRSDVLAYDAKLRRNNRPDLRPDSARRRVLA